jgi:hypothetical protein
MSPLGAAVDRRLGTHALVSHNVITALTTGVVPKFGQVAEIAFSKYQGGALRAPRADTSVGLCLGEARPARAGPHLRPPRIGLAYPASN